MITYKVKGSYRKVTSYLKRASNLDFTSFLHSCGADGVAALKQATPKDTGLTSESWDYKVKKRRGYTSIQWTNSNTVDGVPIAIILQYGHATKTGAFVKGTDYINPALKPVFNNILEKFNSYLKQLR